MNFALMRHMICEATQRNMGKLIPKFDENDKINRTKPTHPNIYFMQHNVYII